MLNHAGTTTRVLGRSAGLNRCDGARQPRVAPRMPVQCPVRLSALGRLGWQSGPMAAALGVAGHSPFSYLMGRLGRVRLHRRGRQPHGILPRPPGSNACLPSLGIPRRAASIRGESGRGVQFELRHRSRRRRIAFTRESYSWPVASMCCSIQTMNSSRRITPSATACVAVNASSSVQSHS